MRRVMLLIAFGLLLAVPGTAAAAETRIDFEELMEGEAVREQYSQQGVRFGQTRDFTLPRPPGRTCPEAAVSHFGGISGTSLRISCRDNPEIDADRAFSTVIEFEYERRDVRFNFRHDEGKQILVNVIALNAEGEVVGDGSTYPFSGQTITLGFSGAAARPKPEIAYLLIYGELEANDSNPPVLIDDIVAQIEPTPAPPKYRLALPGPFRRVPEGGTTATAASVRRFNGSSGPVTLSASLPPGIRSTEFEPNPTSGNAPVAFRIRAGNPATGERQITVSASGGGSAGTNVGQPAVQTVDIYPAVTLGAENLNPVFSETLIAGCGPQRSGFDVRVEGDYSGTVDLAAAGTGGLDARVEPPSRLVTGEGGYGADLLVDPLGSAGTNAVRLDSRPRDATADALDVFFTTRRVEVAAIFPTDEVRKPAPGQFQRVVVRGRFFPELAERCPISFRDSRDQLWPVLDQSRNKEGEDVFQLALPSTAAPGPLKVLGAGTRLLAMTPPFKVVANASGAPEVFVPGLSEGEDPEPSGPPPEVNMTTGRSERLQGARWFSALGSRAIAPARIVRYAWDVGNDGTVEAVCGADAPAISRPFTRPGRYTVKLVVTDSFNGVAETQTVFELGAGDVVPKAPDVTSCEAPVGPSPDRADCVRGLSWGIVDIAVDGGPGRCFTTEGDVWLRDAAQASGTAPFAARTQGPVKLNGLPIPVPGGTFTRYDVTENKLQLGDQPIELKFPFVEKPVNLTKIALTKTVTPDGRGRFKLGGAKPELPGIKALGGLKMGGGAEMTLVGDRSSRSSEVKLSLKLPNIFNLGQGQGMEGTVTLKGENATGFKFNGARMDVPAAFLGPIGLENLFLDYKLKNQQISGGANIQFLPGFGPKILASPKDGYGFVLRDGEFYSAGFGVVFQPAPQIFPGVGLRSVGANFGVNPLRLFGRIGLSVAEIAEIDGTAFLALATRDQPYDFPAEFVPPGLGKLAGRRLDSFSAAVGGDLSLIVPVLGKVKLADAYLFYAHPGLVEAGGGTSFRQDFPGGYVSLKGGVNGFVDFDSGLFNFDGGLEGCLTVDLPWPAGSVSPCLSVGGVVSSRGVGFCGIATLPLPLPPIPIPVGAGLKWGEFPDIYVFSCSYEEYKQPNPRARGRAAQAGRQSFTIPRGLPATMVRLTGQGAPPRVVVEGPNGVRFDTSAPSGQSIVAFEEAHRNATTIAIDKPAVGRWTVTTLPSSVPITKLETADALPEPKVSARLSGSGARRTLRYTTSKPADGERVLFYERGRRTNALIGRARGRRGTLRFTSADGARERRRIVALVERGATKTELTVARFAAAGTQRPARPAKLRVRRRGGRVVASWRRVRGADQYLVTLRPSAGVPVFKIGNRPTATIPFARRGRGTLTVTAIRADAPPGSAARLRLGPARRSSRR